MVVCRCDVCVCVGVCFVVFSVCVVSELFSLFVSVCDCFVVVFGLCVFDVFVLGCFVVVCC